MLVLCLSSRSYICIGKMILLSLLKLVRTLFLEDLVAMLNMTLISQQVSMLCSYLVCSMLSMKLDKRILISWLTIWQVYKMMMVLLVEITQEKLIQDFHIARFPLYLYSIN